MLDQDWLTPSQAGRRLDLSAERVRQLTAEGRLSFIRTPLGRLLDPASVERLAVERRRLRSAGPEGTAA
jgi:excisionase family DNA binding protein